MKKIDLIIKSLFAGALIGLAACIFVLTRNAVEGSLGLICGSLLFSVGLISVILLDAFLFTGKIGYVNNKEKLINVLIGLFFNLVGAYLAGLILRGAVGTQTIFNSRLDKEWYRLLVDGIGCGALIYLAVELYKNKQSIILIILPVMAFIIAGFEHSIADAAYFGMCEFNPVGLLDLLIVIIGNAIGSLIIRYLQTCFKNIIDKSK